MSSGYVRMFLAALAAGACLGFVGGLYTGDTWVSVVVGETK